MTLLKPGMSIVDHISKHLPAIAGTYEGDMAPMEKSKADIRQLLLSERFIIPIPLAEKEVVESKTLATIDGGKVVQQMQTGDICISGAALGEGARFRNIYENEQQTPALGDARVLQHRSGNDELIRTIMGAQEIALMSMIEHDIRIQDGAWLSSTTALYLTLLGRDVSACVEFVKWLASAIEEGMLRGHEIAAGVDRLIAPWRYGDDIDILALSKSDSSQEIATSLLSSSDPAFYNIVAEHHGAQAVSRGDKREHKERFRMMYSDRLLATQVLHPGEMFAPRSLSPGQKFASRLSPDNRKGILPEPGIVRAFKMLRRQRAFPNTLLNDLEYFLVTMLLDKGYEDVNSLRGKNETPFECVESLNDNSVPEESWIWNAFIKPREFLPEQRALKMEYSRVPGISAEDRGAYLGSMVDADVITPDIQEAFSQYIADKRAKEVSNASNMVKSYISSNTTNPSVAMGMLRSYRT